MTVLMAIYATPVIALSTSLIIFAMKYKNPNKNTGKDTGKDIGYGCTYIYSAITAFHKRGTGLGELSPRGEKFQFINLKK